MTPPRDAPRMDSEKPDPRTIPRERDERDDPSPLGRGAAPGTAGNDTAALPSGDASIGGPHGASVPGARGGPSGEIDRENEDAKQTTRDAPRGHASSDNETAR